MNKGILLKILVPLLFLIAVVTAGVFTGVITFSSDSHFDDFNQKAGENESIDSSNQNNTTSKTMAVNMTINYGNGTINRYTINTSNETVYHILMETSKKYNFTVSSTYSEKYGSYQIQSIGGKKNGENSKYWIYYVNNTTGQISADKKIVDNKDEITWRFEKI
ncbi:MAG: DUF4430 domain-containing protein [Candidatus Thermoplasmatota archaeon]